MEPERRRIRFDEVRGRDDQTRWELLDGQLYAMSSPSTLHQDVALELAIRLRSHFRGGPCRLYIAPLDVKLSEYDLVQPDLLVVCQPDQIRPGFIDGPPRLVVEILSPSTERHDRIRKLDLYGKAGIGECWLVTPNPFMIEIYTNQAGTFARASAVSETGNFTSPAFPGLKLDVADLHASLPPTSPPADEVREAEVAYNI